MKSTQVLEPWTEAATDLVFVVLLSGHCRCLHSCVPGGLPICKPSSDLALSEPYLTVICLTYFKLSRT